MFDRKSQIQENYHKSTILKEVAAFYHDRKDISNEEMLEFLLDGLDSYNTSNYYIKRYEDKAKANFIQRFNLVWVWPIFLLSIPFQYLFNGVVGLNRNKRMWKILNFLINLE